MKNHCTYSISQKRFPHLRHHRDFQSMVAVGRLLNCIALTHDLGLPYIEVKPSIVTSKYRQIVYARNGLLQQSLRTVLHLNANYGSEPFFKTFAVLIGENDLPPERKVRLDTSNPPFFIAAEDHPTLLHLKEIDIRGLHILHRTTKADPEWTALAEVVDREEADAAHVRGEEDESYQCLHEVVDELLEEFKTGAVEFI